MIEIAVCFVLFIVVASKPAVIPYFALIYLFIIGIAGPSIVDNLKVSIGPVNILPLDLFFAFSFVASLVFLVKKMQVSASETKVSAWLVLLFVAFFVGKLINGFFSGMPLDRLIRFFMGDAQAIYFFLPLAIYKNKSQLKSLIRFTVVLSLIFPLCQPFLIHTEITKNILREQGTLRLGFGDANVILGYGVIALFAWEYKKYLSFLPLAGIMMLAHRSAYIAIVLGLLALSFVKGKKIKTLMLMGMAGALVIGMLAVLQSFTNINILDKNLSRASETFQSTGTTTSRIGVFPIAVEEFVKRPLTGMDYKELQLALFREEFSPRDFNIAHPHNFVLVAIMNYGLLGSMIMFTLIFKSMRAAYGLTKTEEFKTTGAYLLSAILYFVIFAMMNTTMGSVGYAFWFLCGTTFWFANQQQATKRRL